MAYPMCKNVFLVRNADFFAVKTVPGSNKDLGLNDIDTRNHFRNRMFHLNTRVYFNKVKLIARN
jgi:hypothetical protein